MLAAGGVQDARLVWGMSEITVSYLSTWVRILGQHLISDLLLQANKPLCSALEYLHMEKSLIEYVPLWGILFQSGFIPFRDEPGYSVVVEDFLSKMVIL